MVEAGKQLSELTSIILTYENITDLAKSTEVYVLTNTQKQSSQLFLTYL